MTLFQSGEKSAGPPPGIGGVLSKLFGRRLLPASDDALPSSIYGFILRYSFREQVYLVVVTLLSFAVSLLLAIAGVVLAARLRAIHPDMTFAYRHIALPAAAIVAGIVFVSAAFMEVRHYQRAKTLNRIENVS